MAEVSSGITQACEAFLKSLEEERYYDAHEDLEALWFPRRFEEEDEVKVWKGFINAAVSFELMKKGRSKPAQTPWNTYLKYRVLLEGLVTPYKELYVKMDDYIQNRRT